MVDEDGQPMVNDDYGGLQSRIPHWVCQQTGTYVVAVRAYSPTQTGSFTVQVSFEEPTAPCGPPTPCFNGGVCVEEGFRFNCQCPDGFSGPACSQGGEIFDICGDSSQHPSAGEVGILFDGTEGDGYINGQASSPFFPMQSMRAACSPWLWCINN